MQCFVIAPHEGIGPIKLGAPREEVRQALNACGFPLEHVHGNVEYFCQAAIQVEFGDSGRAEFIGVSVHMAFVATYAGADVFDVPASELFRVMAQRDGSGTHHYTSSEYLFPGQILTLWDADEQYDHRGGEQRVVWAQVGLGNSDYVRASQAIRAGSPLS